MVHPSTPVVFGRKGLPQPSGEQGIQRQALHAGHVYASVRSEAATDQKPDTKRRGLLATIFLPLILVLKLFKLGKIGGTAITMVLSLVFYSVQFGWRYAAGFIGLLFLHEMGHYLAARRRGLHVGTPTFIPFVGAWIELKEQPMDAETEAYVALAGPLIGTLGATACYLLARELGSTLLLAVAYAGFFLNFFNLIPLSPLDGGRITSVLSPRIWFLGVPVMLALMVYRPSPLLVLIAIMAIPSLKKAWRYDRNAPENRAYYDMAMAKRLEYTALYIALAAYLGLMTSVAHSAINAAAAPAISPAPAAEVMVGKGASNTGDMPVWARLYPGAQVVRDQKLDSFGLADWRKTLSVKASPEQIGAFYEAQARAEGFTNTQTLLGLHRFMQPGTNNMFSYMVFQNAGQSMIVFEARTDARH